ncbi:MAG: MmcB family DNA repair protein [Alphaproteobacteria bacterium]|nr:MmcB family DNA repair protein [Alphaproteobacteria bacterium]
MLSLPAFQAFGEAAPPGRAADIVRGVQRMMAEMGYATLAEVGLANGRRADVMALSAKGEIVIVEIKSCLVDFTTDQKWPEYRPYCDRFLFAVDCDFPDERLPEEAGLIVADAFGGAIIREAGLAPLTGGRRKAVTLAFGRLAAVRLLRARENDGGLASNRPEA